jgi:hypothetical protein
MKWTLLLIIFFSLTAFAQETSNEELEQSVQQATEVLGDNYSIDPTAEIENEVCGVNDPTSSATVQSILSGPDCQFKFGCRHYEHCVGKIINCDKPNKPDYFSDYGGKYCLRFKNAHNNPAQSGFNEGSKVWARCTLICLQRALDKEMHCTDLAGNIPTGETANKKCERYYNVAFDSHPDCYTDSGICLLAPPTQQAYIATMVDPSDLITPESRKQVYLATSNCAYSLYDIYNGGFAKMNAFQKKVFAMESAGIDLDICELKHKAGLVKDCMKEQAVVASFRTVCTSASRPKTGWDCSKDWNEGSNQFNP